MKLRQLFEAPGDTVGLIFGRFNPPHKGHKAAWQMCSKNTHWYVGTNRETMGPTAKKVGAKGAINKDPLKDKEKYLLTYKLETLKNIIQ